MAFEDHAVRACLGHLASKTGCSLAVNVRERDGADLQLRVGLNSGEVFAGQMGAPAVGYTAIGEQVGMAQRMESVARPGVVMLSASTARLVEGTAAMGDAEFVSIKGAEEPIPARRLLGMDGRRRAAGRDDSAFVGRRWEMAAVESLLDGAVEGHGTVVGLVGPAGMGKSRVVREITAIAQRRGVEVITSSVSHTPARSHCTPWDGCYAPPSGWRVSTRRQRAV
ncbi:adenylate/guanylate cyclase domain-containing protein [Mycobacterium sp. URHB0021]